jgi:hypothetical protein
MPDESVQQWREKVLAEPLRQPTGRCKTVRSANAKP